MEYRDVSEGNWGRGLTMDSRDQIVKILLRAVSDGICLDTRADVEELADYISENLAPVKRGRWVSVDGTEECDEWDCSECGRRLTFGEEMSKEEVAASCRWCSGCGTRMDLGVENNAE